MRFVIRVGEKGSSRTWSETYDRPDLGTYEACLEWATQTIQSFNIQEKAIGGNQAERVLIEVISLGMSELPLQHDWEKSNLVTIIEEGRRPYDTYKCTRCKATGKRYGLDSHIVLDDGQPPRCRL